MQSHQTTLGAVIRGLRIRNGWTLKELSKRGGIPVSTLSKVEHDRLTLTYDKLQQFSRRLNIRMSELFADGEPAQTATVLGRRSISNVERALRINTPNYDYFYLCTELRQKLMVPNLINLKSRTIEEFGNLVRHPGEEFIYVVTGRIVVHTEFYDPVALDTGECMYIDSEMGHAYLLGEDCSDATVMTVMSSVADGLMAALISNASDQRRD